MFGAVSEALGRARISDGIERVEPWKSRSEGSVQTGRDRRNGSAQRHLSKQNTVTEPCTVPVPSRGLIKRIDDLKGWDILAAQASTVISPHTESACLDLADVAFPWRGGSGG